MAYIWKCEACDLSIGGSAKEFAAKALSHFKWAKSHGEEHLIHLVDDETGEIPLDEAGQLIRSPAKAQRLGLIPGTSGRRPLKSNISSASKTSAALRGRVSPVDVPLDPRLQFLYEWDRMMVPAYEGNLSQWIWDSVLGFHIQNKEAFKMDRLFQEMS